MAKKDDINKIIEKYRPVLTKFGDDMGKAAKKGEENVKVMSKMFKIQLDMMGISLQKEKLYYNLGKEVAEKLMKDELTVEGLEKYKKQLNKMDSDDKKKKKAMSRVKKSGKAKKS